MALRTQLSYSSVPPPNVHGVLDAAAPGSHRRSSLLRSLATVARGEPSRGALVSVLASVQAAFGVAAVVQTWLLAPPAVVRVVVPVVSVTTLVYVAAYALARLRRSTTASWLMVAAQMIIPPLVVAGLPAPALSPMSTAAWSIVAILTASATLGARAVLVTGLVNAAMFPVSLGLASRFTLPVDEGALFLLVITGLVYVYARHRDAREQARRAVIESRNLELEDLRGTLEQRVQERTQELAEIARRLEHAYETQRSQLELLVQTEKMAAVGRLSAGFAHELASPLQAIAAAVADAENLRREYADSIGDTTVTADDHGEIAAELAEALGLVRAATERCVRFVSNIRAHTRDPGPQAIELFDASKVAQEAVELVAYPARHAGVRLVVNCTSGSAPMSGVPSRFHQVVTNLLQNAIDAVADVGRAGTVTLLVAREGADVLVSVEDDGPGVPSAIIERIFEPMFTTTKPYGKGTGLGLSIARDIVRNELKGTLQVHDRTGGGAVFTVRAPMAEG